MKQDIAIVFDGVTGERDIALGNDGDLLATEGFDTAISNSLLVNRRASPTEVIPPYLRRGWIGDLAPPAPAFQVGSKLWLFEQRRLVQEVVNEIRDAAAKALEWLVEVGAARDVRVSASAPTPHSVIITADVFIFGVGTRRYSNVWIRTAYNRNI